jgi:redox-sensitive bicupin YhaK (pirin superfamily)
MKTETINKPSDAQNKQMLVYRSQSRGQANYGWLKTKYSFSFANYFDRERVHFGALRVLNDDIIAPGKGFDLHPHDNMEIITIPLYGALRHTDSMGHTQDIVPDEVQVMSAGTGLFHSEYNASNKDDVGLFQIWIIPQERNVDPVYNQARFDAALARGQWQQLVGPVGSENLLTIHQQAYVSRVFLAQGEKITYTPHNQSYGCFLMVAEGEVDLNDVTLYRRDSAGIINNGSFEISAHANSYLINIEVTDIPKG